MKMFLLKETGQPIRLFRTFKAADKAMEERVSYWVGCHILVKKISKCKFEGYLNEEDIEISIIEQEVEG